jgi:hypothetical protein
MAPKRIPKDGVVKSPKTDKVIEKINPKTTSTAWSVRTIDGVKKNRK